MQSMEIKRTWGWAWRGSLAFLTLLLVWCAVAVAAPVSTLQLTQRDWQVDGVTRQALIHIPPSASTENVPVIFAFHGHGGGMSNTAEKFAYHRLWPEAITVYPQGLPTQGRFDPNGQSAGWQNVPGENNDRDLRFFDAILSSLKRDYKIDNKRIYATGHSNGGSFTYLLWATRGDLLAAVAPSAGASARVFRLLKPLPALHVAGERDEAVAFANQQRTMQRIRRLNGCEAQGQPWAEAGALVGTQFESKSGTPFVSLIHPGTHKFPEAAPALIVKFFKEHTQVKTNR